MIISSASATGPAGMSAAGEIAEIVAHDVLVEAAQRVGLRVVEVERIFRSRFGAGSRLPAVRASRRAAPRSPDDVLATTTGRDREPTLDDALLDPDLHAEYVAPYATEITAIPGAAPSNATAPVGVRARSRDVDGAERAGMVPRGQCRPAMRAARRLRVAWGPTLLEFG